MFVIPFFFQDLWSEKVLVFQYNCHEVIATSPTPKAIATIFSRKLELMSQLRFALHFIKKSTRSI